MYAIRSYYESFFGGKWDLKGRILPVMFQLSKKVEYALIAMRHMAISRGSGVVTAKEIAEKYAIV